MDCESHRNGQHAACRLSGEMHAQSGHRPLHPDTANSMKNTESAIRAIEACKHDHDCFRTLTNSRYKISAQGSKLKAQRTQHALGNGVAQQLQSTNTKIACRRHEAVNGACGSYRCNREVECMRACMWTVFMHEHDLMISCLAL